tara:strand:- start:50 stop:334 length:285 start_codon:yes stop_codon:yes gene_type:complete
MSLLTAAERTSILNTFAAIADRIEGEGFAAEAFALRGLADGLTLDLPDFDFDDDEFTNVDDYREGWDAAISLGLPWPALAESLRRIYLRSSGQS